MKQIVLSLLVDNTPGVLSRVAGLFTRRGYNIDSIAAGTTQNAKYTRITVVATGDDIILEQIQKQLLKLEDVVKIMRLDNHNAVCRELILIKIKTDKNERKDIVAIADIFRANIVDASKHSMIIELTGDVNKIDAFLNLLADYDVIETVRTGLTGLGRGNNIARVE